MFVKIDDLEPKPIINFYLPQEIKVSDTSLVLENPAQVTNTLMVGVLSIAGVTKLLLTDKLLSVHYRSEDKDDVRLSVLAELDDYFADTQAEVEEQSNVSDIERAEALADAFIRPTLNRDKGDIDILALTDGVLTIKFTGHCAGCPYAQNTLQNVIAKTMLHYMPLIKKIDLEEA